MGINIIPTFDYKQGFKPKLIKVKVMFALWLPVTGFSKFWFRSTILISVKENV